MMGVSEPRWGVRTIRFRGELEMLDMYQSYVLQGGPLDGFTIRARAGTIMVHAVNPDGSAKVTGDMGDLIGVPPEVPADTLVAYKRVTVFDHGPFGHNEYHWVDPETIGNDDD